MEIFFQNFEKVPVSISERSLQLWGFSGGSKSAPPSGVGSPSLGNDSPGGSNHMTTRSHRRLVKTLLSVCMTLFLYVSNTYCSPITCLLIYKILFLRNGLMKVVRVIFYSRSPPNHDNPCSAPGPERPSGHQSERQLSWRPRTRLCPLRQRRPESHRPLRRLLRVRPTPPHPGIDTARERRQIGLSASRTAIIVHQRSS